MRGRCTNYVGVDEGVRPYVVRDNTRVPSAIISGVQIYGSMTKWVRNRN